MNETWAQAQSVRDTDPDLFYPLVVPREFEFAGQRHLPDYEPVGGRVGGFIFYPTVEVEELYRTNIYRSANNEKSDFITTVKPSLRFQSDWNRHELVIAAGAAGGFYKSSSDDNFIDLHLKASNRLDLGNAIRVNSDVGLLRRHEERGDTDVPGNAAEPIIYNMGVLNSAVMYKPGRLGIGAVIRGKYYDFQDVKLIATNQKQSNNDRDRLELAYGVQLTYDVKPGYQTYVELLRTDKSYDRTFDKNGFRRDSSGYQANVGTRLKLSNVVVADLSVGYVRAKYDDQRFDTVNDVRASAIVNWNVTPLTTIRFRLARDIRETTLIGSSSSVQMHYGITVDHELRRNIILGLDLGTMRENFQGIAQNEKTHTIGVRADYRLNRRWFTRGSYHYVTRSSNAGGRDFKDNRIMFSIGTNF